MSSPSRRPVDPVRLPAAFLLLALIPAVTAQVPGSADVTLSPATGHTLATNETVATLAVGVGLSLGDATCPLGGLAVVDLAATGSMNESVRMEPTRLSFDVAALDSLPVAGSADYSGSSTLLVTMGIVGSPRDVNVTVMATASVECTGGVPSYSDSAEASYLITFQPPQGGQVQVGSEEVMPGPGLVLLAGGLLVAGLVMRRRQA